MKAQTKPKPKAILLDKTKVKIALIQRGWSQVRLAKEVGKHFTTVNLAINHGSYPEVVKLIRKKLNL